MKKRVFAIGIIVLLLISLSFITLIYAQEAVKPPVPDSPLDSPGQVSSDDNNIKSVGTNLNEQTNDFLQKDIQLSPAVQRIVRLIFGVKEDTIEFRFFIVLMTVWLMLFIVIASALNVMFSKIKSLFMSLVITLIIAIPGSINYLTIAFFNLISIFGFFENYQIILLILIVGVVILVIYFAMRFSKKLKEKVETEKAGQEGQKVGAVVKFFKELKEVFSDIPLFGKNRKK